MTEQDVQWRHQTESSRLCCIFRGSPGYSLIGWALPGSPWSGDWITASHWPKLLGHYWAAFAWTYFCSKLINTSNTGRVTNCCVTKSCVESEVSGTTQNKCGWDTSIGLISYCSCDGHRGGSGGDSKLVIWVSDWGGGAGRNIRMALVDAGQVLESHLIMSTVFLYWGLSLQQKFLVRNFK